MKKLSTISSNVGRLTTRVALSLIVFFAANYIYPDVFDTVGYMYNISLSVSYAKYSVGAFFLIVLLSITHFKSPILRHGFDVIVLGIYLPIAVIVTQTSASTNLLLYPVLSILSMSISVRVFEGMRLIKQLNSTGLAHFSLSSLQSYIFVPYALAIIFLILSNPSMLNLNILETYVNTYDIRSENSADGIFGYFVGWFVLLFFPLFLSKVNIKLAVIAPFFAFLGALYVFQTFAVKVIFLNFFLMAIFAFVYRSKYFLYFPQILFFALFLVSYLFGWMLHPLIDRFFYLVGLNSIFYFDFFNLNPLRFFEGTKLDLGVSNYGLDAGYLIDRAYYQGLGTNQSAGFLPTIYSDFGVLGIFVFSLIVGLLISLIKSIHTSSTQYSYLLMIAFAFSLMNHPINMLFLSNGLVFILIFAFILRRNRFA